MSDNHDHINGTHRALGTRRIPAGEGTAVLLRRHYAADVADVWDACTDPKRIGRWFLPVEGDLRPGGSYQLDGNAGGDILRCEPPRLLKVTWVFGEDPGESDVSEVEVRLTADGEGTLFELEHTGVVPPEMWAEFGPGATGVGWDLGLLGLAWHLADGRTADPDTWAGTPEGREFVTASSRAWGAAHRAAGADAETADTAARKTAAFYAPEPGAQG
ncbi:uncharacterized protein YndB with AHSA1/START domain [Murinocardiopsis flavida]|uniref:Uncharacterized protein YndB with AHSA1/START domain n=1 Tax=Murinocardiopsis flavida TaxID=645275 RepID=A0A2P8DKM6_9ACTN|nr:SRPBCC family protein [Murinocardiopsis flavida]PSK97764.1 uncharacterized protein YndB with AHSA1/START domain [Murinocardiopsis flavida]